MDQATREIMWMIPPSFKLAMYAMFFLSTAIMIYGLYRKLKFVAGDQPLSSLFGSNGIFKISDFQWGQFFKTIFMQGKVPRKKYVGAFHGLIYYGFIILWIATDLVAIHYDTPFKIFKGPLYIVISFLADIAGIAIITGLAIAYHRRYIKKPDSLSATKPNQELYMYAMLFNLVVVGYLIEGLRILGTGMPIGEQSWAPIGYFLAVVFQNFNLSEPQLALFYRVLWFFHMASTMVFIGSIGFSKFSHFIFAPLSSLITPTKRAAILGVMDFENEEAESFGLGNPSELTLKNKWDIQICVECGRCSDVCPANLAGKPLDPKTIITKMRDHCESEGGDLWTDNSVYSFNEIDACTTCGACVEECPMHIEHIPMILELKRYKVLTLGEIPPAAADAVSKIKNNGNPWGISQEDRFSWADGLDVPVAEPEKKIDYLYYVGCAGSYDAANQQVVKDTVALLKSAGVDFAVMGKTEKCNGDPVRRFGDEYSFYEIAIENIANMNKYKFDKVVTHCPHCLHTIGKEYAKFEDGDFETVHHTELLAELLKNGKLKTNKSIDETYTFHDPCYLGRHHGEYNAPREVLGSIPGLKIKEMEKSKDKALCCGMGGGNMWYELEEGEHLAVNRLKQVAEVKPDKLATGCSFCLINFNSSKGHEKETEEMEINDVASILAKSIL
jgi:Fe-S oxidoreductase